MNTNQNSPTFRKKISPEVVFSLNNRQTLINPREDSQGALYVCNECGDLLTFNEDGNYSTFSTLGGMPRCIFFSNSNNSIFIADLMNKVVYEKPLDKEKEKEINLIFKDYCGIPLKGPTSIIGSPDDDYIIVTDAGLFGSSGITNQNGSIYLYDIINNVLRPIILNNLSYPCDIYHDKEEDIFYVCDMISNRVLRMVQNPKGVFHTSVFYNFNGKLGPSAIGMDDMGNIYVARYDFFAKNNKNGIISIITKEGNLVGEIIVEGYCEINGILIPKNNKKEGNMNKNTNNSNESNNGNVIYFTDRNFSGVLKIKLSAISQELEKLHENKF